MLVLVLAQELHLHRPWTTDHRPQAKAKGHTQQTVKSVGSKQ
jgi:hypothetical protein